MKLYRLVDQANDPTMVGQALTRTSTHSNQKNGHGMYFGMDVFECLRFQAATKAMGKLKYTHLLEVDVPFQLTDFFDLRANVNAIVRSRFNGLPVNQRYLQFCQNQGKIGLIWSSMGANAWTELVIHTPSVPAAGFPITNSAPV